MTSPEDQSPEPRPAKPAAPEPDAGFREPPEPVIKDRVYRSSGGVLGGVLLLGLAAWLGVDAIVSGEGRTPWLALAALIIVVPLIIAFTLRPAVYAGPDRLRVRNPFRLIVLPWGQVATLRSGYSNEAIAVSGKKFQLWSIPVSLRARKRAARGKSGRFGGAGASAADAPLRARGDRDVDELREVWEARQQEESAQGEVSVRWAWEILGPAAAGAVVLGILLAVG